MERTYGRLLRKQSAAQVDFRCQHHIVGHHVERQAACPEVGAFERFPIVVDFAPVALHANLIDQVYIGRHSTAGTEARPHPAVGVRVALRRVVVQQLQGLYLEDIVPQRIVLAGYGIIIEVHLSAGRIEGIERNVGGGSLVCTEPVVPQHRVHYHPVFVEIKPAGSRSVLFSRIGSHGTVVVGHGTLQHHAAPVAIDGSVGTSGVVRHHAGGEDQVFRMVAAVAAFRVGVVQIDSRTVECRVVGEHAAVHQSVVLHVDGPTVGSGVVVVEQRVLHHTVLQVDGSAVGSSVVFGKDASGEAGVAPVHVDARSAVGPESHARQLRVRHGW